MIVSLRRGRWPGVPRPVPQRRRVIVIGATEAGVACTFHLGHWAMLIEQRGSDTVNGVTIWEAPALTTAGSARRAPTWDDLWRGLVQLARGETRLATRVTALMVHERRLEVSTGESFVYDKLVSTLPLERLQTLIVDTTPGRLRSDEAWRYWLNARDIELLDSSARLQAGDVDGQAAGKRVADTIRGAIALKFASKSALDARQAGLFHPRIVPAAVTHGKCS
jgi:hypothetical protein